MNRVTIITLGVTYLAKARTFYEMIGWAKADARSNLIFFPAAGYNLCLYPRDDLAAELGCVPEELGMGKTLLTVNWRTEAQVADAFSHALDCGATALRLPAKMPWGGYSGYWADPDGNVWEYAHDPTLTVAENGQLGP
jgi:predicted lactoylglutathione lyase